MKKQIVITKWQSEILTALYEDDHLAELWLEPPASRVRVGDIYIGKVKNIVPNIQAAFVEIGPKIMGYYSLSTNIRHHFVNVKKNDKLVAGDEIIVQVEKENLKTKAWTLTGNISLPGRYMVFNSDKKQVMLSSKIKSEDERNRLKAIVEEVAPAEAGWLIRTEASGKAADQVINEMNSLSVDYNKIMSTSKMRTCYSKLRSGDALYIQAIRQMHEGDNCTVTVDQREIYEQLKCVFTASEQINLKFYEDTSYPLIKLKGIEAQIEKALQPRVWLKSGAYLVIEPTEALTVIDVNTGKAIGKQNIDEHFFHINMEAAKEILRQLRLRNISGIIIVDFINMKNREHMRELMEYLRREAVRDSVQTTIVDQTALHLVEITRKKTRRPLAEQFKKDCKRIADKS